MARSVATIDSPEFISVTPVNPLISKCEIKVMYVGENRNHSFISKAVATEMANSLPGCPIVGYFKEDTGDFTDHGQRITMDNDGVKFEVLTKPYGFVAPDAQIWFQKFDDTDEFGNTVTREYLMTTGYLWTGQYEEAQRTIEQGNNQSMELDEKSLQGKWATNNNTGVEFFIINDAIFSKLAILGEDVEPCFEGASITAPEVSASFTLDDSYRHTLFAMMQDLRHALEPREGGLDMTREDVLASGKSLSEMTSAEFALLTEDDKAEFAKKAAPADPEDKQDGGADEADEEKKSMMAKKAGTKCELDADAEFAAKTAADKKKADEVAAAKEDAADDGVDDAAENPDGTKKKPATKSQLEIDFEALQTQFATLESEIVALREFKLTTEDKQKDALIKSFYMLSDEDKEDVVTNKSNYSLDDIESKLAVICVRNKVSFDLEDEGPDKPTMTFNLEDEVDTAGPLVQLLRNVKHEN